MGRVFIDGVEDTIIYNNLAEVLFQIEKRNGFYIYYYKRGVADFKYSIWRLCIRAWDIRKEFYAS